MAGPVLLVRSSSNHTDAEALAAVGIETVTDPYLAVRTRIDEDAISQAYLLRAQLEDATWVIATSSTGIRAWGELLGIDALKQAFAAAKDRGVRFAAIGETTAQMYASFGINDVLVASTAYAEVLADEVIIASAGQLGSAVIPLGSIALSTLSHKLLDAGWTVHTATLYETNAVSSEPTSVSLLNAGGFAAVVLRSPSAARAVAGWANSPANVKVVCCGNTTATEARLAGLEVIAVCPDPSAQTLARIVSESIGGAA